MISKRTRLESRSSSLDGKLTFIDAIDCALLFAIVFFLVTSSPSLAQDKATKDKSLTAESKDQITAELAMEFVRDFQKLIAEGKYAELDDLLDFTQIAERAAVGLVADAKTLQDIQGGMANGMRQRGLFKGIGQQIEKGGSYTFIGFDEKIPNNAKPVFRFLPADGGFNYHVLYLGKSGDKFKIIDLLYAASGEPVSSSLRDIMKVQLQSQPGFVGKLLGSKDVSADDSKSFAKMGEFVRANKHQEALDEYAKLSKSMRESKIVFSMHMTALGNVGSNQQIEKAADEFAKLFPNDPSLALMMLDAAVTRKDERQLEKCINSLIEIYGDKDYLKTFLAASLVAIGDNDKARKELQEFNLENCHESNVHDLALNCAISLEDHELALRELKMLQERFGYRFQDLRTVEAYKNFVTSPQFQEWEAFQAK
jgi:hypothetical protein